MSYNPVGAKIKITINPTTSAWLTAGSLRKSPGGGRQATNILLEQDDATTCWPARHCRAGPTHPAVSQWLEHHLLVQHELSITPRQMKVSRGARDTPLGDGSCSWRSFFCSFFVVLLKKKKLLDLVWHGLVLVSIHPVRWVTSYRLRWSRLRLYFWNFSRQAAETADGSGVFSRTFCSQHLSGNHRCQSGSLDSFTLCCCHVYFSFVWFFFLNR